MGQSPPTVRSTLEDSPQAAFYSFSHRRRTPSSAARIAPVTPAGRWARLSCGAPATDVQSADLWSFVGMKEKTKVPHAETSPELGDADTFLGVERTSKLLLAHHFGRRTAADAAAVSATKGVESSLMEAEILTTFTGLAGAAKATLEAVRAIHSKSKGNREAEKAAREALALADDLLARLLQLKDVALDLQEENRQIREELRRERERAAEGKKYRRKQTRSGAVVLAREDEPNVFFCPSCSEAKQIFVPLQRKGSSPTDFGVVVGHECPQCKARYLI